MSVYVCVHVCMCALCSCGDQRLRASVFLSCFPFCLYLLTLFHTPSFLHEYREFKFRSLSCPLDYFLSLPTPIWTPGQWPKVLLLVRWTTKPTWTSLIQLDSCSRKKNSFLVLIGNKMFWYELRSKKELLNVYGL